MGCLPRRRSRRKTDGRTEGPWRGPRNGWLAPGAVPRPEHISRHTSERQFIALKQQFINLNRQSMDCESSPGHRFQGLGEELRLASRASGHRPWYCGAGLETGAEKWVDLAPDRLRRRSPPADRCVPSPRGRRLAHRHPQPERDRGVVLLPRTPLCAVPMASVSCVLRTPPSPYDRVLPVVMRKASSQEPEGEPTWQRKRAKSRLDRLLEYRSLCSSPSWCWSRRGVAWC